MTSHRYRIEEKHYANYSTEYIEAECGRGEETCRAGEVAAFHKEIWHDHTGNRFEHGPFLLRWKRGPSSLVLGKPTYKQAPNEPTSVDARPRADRAMAPELGGISWRTKFS